MGTVARKADAPKRDDHRIIIHFDYDCFYAAVFENENPALKSLPLAVQQKQIIVTCNYEARKRGLYKLQLIREAKEKCPDVIIVLGEDLTRFRNASKDNYNFLRSFTWSNKVERLGFDEVFMDVTDLVDYNVGILNRTDLSTAFFCLDRNDPTVGFSYQPDTISGHAFPSNAASRQKAIPTSHDDEALLLRLRLGSHLAQHLRLELEHRKGYTCTVGISTNKLLSKLVGNVNKPNGQTTLVPPYVASGDGVSHVHDFIDEHDIGKLPGIGFKIAQKIRQYVLGRPAAFDAGLVYGGSKENVKVRDVRLLEGMGTKLLDRILQGPGTPKDLPEKVWGLINGVDDTEVARGREVPQQISIEDSYIKLDELSEVKKELRLLSTSLIKRMRVDLMSTSSIDEMATAAANGMDEPADVEAAPIQNDTDPDGDPHWIAHPKTLRLSTRPRPPLKPDGTRTRSFARISRSCPLPSFVFQLHTPVETQVNRLVEDTLLPLFSKLHPEKRGWDLSLVNLCVTNMVMAATADSSNERSSRGGRPGGGGGVGLGRDISKMFRRQDQVLREWKVEDVDVPPSPDHHHHSSDQSSDHEEDERVSGRAESAPESEFVWDEEMDLDDPCPPSPSKAAATAATGEGWHSEDDDKDDDDDNDDDTNMMEIGRGMGEGDVFCCPTCGALMPSFAGSAHRRFHELEEQEEE